MIGFLFNMFVLHRHFHTHAAHELTPARPGRKSAKFAYPRSQAEEGIPDEQAQSSLRLTNHATLAYGEPSSAGKPANQSDPGPRRTVPCNRYKSSQSMMGPVECKVVASLQGCCNLMATSAGC